VRGAALSFAAAGELSLAADPVVGAVSGEPWFTGRPAPPPVLGCVPPEPCAEEDALVLALGTITGGAVPDAASGEVWVELASVVEVGATPTPGNPPLRLPPSLESMAMNVRKAPAANPAVFSQMCQYLP
jgi:hypothetical protein